MEPVRVVWSLVGSGLGTTLNAAGNSGGWANIPNVESAVDLRYVDDVAVLAAVTGLVTGTTPTLNVQLDLFDDIGNLIFQVGKLPAALTATAQSGMFSVGKHAGTGQVVLSSWGRISWTVGGTASPTFGGVEISVFGR
jgi:hypothetical protein